MHSQDCLRRSSRFTLNTHEVKCRAHLLLPGRTQTALLHIVRSQHNCCSTGLTVFMLTARPSLSSWHYMAGERMREVPRVRDRGKSTYLLSKQKQKSENVWTGMGGLMVECVKARLSLPQEILNSMAKVHQGVSPNSCVNMAKATLEMEQLWAHLKIVRKKRFGDDFFWWGYPIWWPFARRGQPINHREVRIKHCASNFVQVNRHSLP